MQLPQSYRAVLEGSKMKKAREKQTGLVEWVKLKSGRWERRVREWNSDEARK